MVRNDRRAGARRFASPRFALASPRSVYCYDVHVGGVQILVNVGAMLVKMAVVAVAAAIVAKLTYSLSLSIQKCPSAHCLPCEPPVGALVFVLIRCLQVNRIIRMLVRILMSV